MHHGGIEKNISILLERSAAEVLSDSGLQVTLTPGQELKADLEIPKERSHGDLATSIAMRAAKRARKNPMELASLIKARFDAHLASSGFKESIGSVDIKEPGFMNFSLSHKHLSKVIFQIKREKAHYGSSGIGRGIKLQVEFVSANPTGPLTIAHGRQAAIGDSLASILEFLGYNVSREYYLNDEGTQIDILGNSIRLRYLELCGKAVEFPADGYKGAYIIDIAKEFKKKYKKKFVKEGGSIEPFKEFGLSRILKTIKKDLRDFGVRFNVWYSQKALRKSGKVQKAIAFLKDKGYIYKQDGAVWFKSQAFGDDKDRVVYKTDGSATYLAPDIAYHQEKFRRGFKKLIDIWGPDHHGYVPRMKAAIRALGFPEDSLSVLIVQLATLYRGDQVLSMSTRAGEFITLREVMDEVGKDAARFCFLMRRISSHLDFDLEAVKKESPENPVYYIQYAHARIWSILRYGKRAHIAAKFNSSLLNEKEEIDLMRMLREFPMIVALSGKFLEPYIILQYLQDLATSFHSFYNKHRVVSDNLNLTKSRLVLVDCVRTVLANGLRLLGVSLPKKM